ncbi:SRPBCC family protein [Nonomuraea sp. M3C6]|uniref:SRPBCC family protein n=1 Tax=Nonomuraea marmarensis TaxID=3351344 RepID=A0ABW7AQP0_9ACTN
MARPHHESVHLHIKAAPQAIWSLIADITRMGEWSPICRRCAWLAPVTGPVAGARFVGHNRIGGLRWSRECEVLVSEPGAEFTFRSFVGGRPSTLWRYLLVPDGAAGTRVTEEYTVTSDSSSPRWVTALESIPAIRERNRAAMRNGMIETLQRIKAAAEAGAPAQR